MDLSDMKTIARYVDPLKENTKISKPFLEILKSRNVIKAEHIEDIEREVSHK